MANLCPFDETQMTLLPGNEASLKLLQLLISPQSSMYNLAKGSLRNNFLGSMQECSSCGYLAIFTKK